MLVVLSAQSPEKQRKLTVIVNRTAYDLNPQTQSYSVESQILTALYEGLFSYNPITLMPEKALIKSYKVSKDKKTWTFEMRDNLQFSDGTPITAETVRQSWLKLLAPETAAPFASMLDCIKGVPEYRSGAGSAEDVKISADGNTLKVRLSLPTGHLDKILCHMSFSVVPEEDGVFSGPYVIESSDENGLHLVKNTFYYGADHVMIPEMDILYADSAEDAEYKFNTGAADWLICDVDYDRIYDSESVYINANFGTEYFYFSTDKAPFDDPLVRNALLAAIDWEKLWSSYRIPAETLILPLLGYPEVSVIGDTDLELAMELLEEAGYTDRELVITLGVPNYAVFGDLAQFLAECWSKINVTTNLIYEPFIYSIDAVVPADLHLQSWLGDYPDPTAFLEMFRTGSSLNFAHWSDEKFDSLLEEAASQNTEAKRYEKLAEAEERLLKEGVIIPLCRTVTGNCINTYEIGGWFPNSLNLHPFKYMFFRDETYSTINVVKYVPGF